MEKLEEIAAAMEKTAKKLEYILFRRYKGCRKRTGGRCIYHNNRNGEIEDGVNVGGERWQSQEMPSL